MLGLIVWPLCVVWSASPPAVANKRDGSDMRYMGDGRGASASAGVNCGERKGYVGLG